MSKQRRKPIEAVNGLYAAIPHAVLDSVAFRDASHTARSLLFDLLRQHDGRNNGHLQLTTSWLQKRGWLSRDVVQRAKAELEDRGLVVRTRRGGLNMGADQFAVTWLAVTNFNGLDIGPHEYHPGAWNRLTQLPMPRLQPSSGSLTAQSNALTTGRVGSTGKRNSTVPTDGTAHQPPVPADGAETAPAHAIPVPSDGNNEYMPLGMPNSAASDDGSWLQEGRMEDSST